jgi:hypothetical protein
MFPRIPRISRFLLAFGSLPRRRQPKSCPRLPKFGFVEIGEIRVSHPCPSVFIRGWSLLLWREICLVPPRLYLYHETNESRMQIQIET